MEQLIQNVLTHIELICNEAKLIYGKSPVISKVRFDKRGTVAGTCTYNNGKFELNFNKILLKEYRYEFIHETVTHEVAHAIDWVVNRKSGHSKTWKDIMVRFGAKPNRLHSYNVDKCRVVKAKYVYECDCTKHNLTSIRHNRAKKGVVYRCKLCKTPLKFSHEI